VIKIKFINLLFDTVSDIWGIKKHKYSNKKVKLLIVLTALILTLIMILKDKTSIFY